MADKGIRRVHGITIDIIKHTYAEKNLFQGHFDHHKCEMTTMRSDPSLLGIKLSSMLMTSSMGLK
jgi:hypothetical protein